MYFCCFSGAKWSFVDGFGVETGWTQSFSWRDMVVGDKRWEGRDREGIFTRSLQAAWECKQHVFSILVTSCTPHMAVIPFFLSSTLRYHSLGTHIWLCLLPSHPNGSTLQTKGFQHPYYVLHCSHCYHSVFLSLDLLASLVSRPYLASLLRQQYAAKHTKTQHLHCMLVQHEATYQTCCFHSSSTTTLHSPALWSCCLVTTPQPFCILQFVTLTPPSSSSCHPPLCPPHCRCNIAPFLVRQDNDFRQLC